MGEPTSGFQDLRAPIYVAKPPRPRAPFLSQLWRPTRGISTSKNHEVYGSTKDFKVQFFQLSLGHSNTTKAGEVGVDGG